MALTREYKPTVMARIKRDPKFARALYAEAVTALLDGETAEGLSMLRDLAHIPGRDRIPPQADSVLKRGQPGRHIPAAGPMSSIPGADRNGRCT